MTKYELYTYTRHGEKRTGVKVPSTSDKPVSIASLIEIANVVFPGVPASRLAIAPLGLLKKDPDPITITVLGDGP